MNRQMKRWLEGAIFIGFTGTPLLRKDTLMDEQRERLQGVLSHLKGREGEVLLAGIRTVNKCLGALRTL
jgi:hypothetical protein